MRFLKFVIVAILASSTAYADERKIPEPFRGEQADSPIEITYNDLSFILRNTVIGSPRSSRTRALRGTQGAPTGSRLSRGNKSDTRNEGNRINLKILSEELNLSSLTSIRKSLEQVPSEVPMKHWKKDEQLAYWLNLYNVTLIEQLAMEYPFRKLKGFKKGKNNLWAKKLLNVAGVPLSLNDIQHTILPNKWDSTLFMYGLYQGYIGGPSIQKRAFTGENVDYQLASSAREFINSNRGVKVSGKTLKVSAFYKENAALFPDWQADIKKHVASMAYKSMKGPIENTSKIKTLRMDYFTTDLYAGGRIDIIPQSSNPAAMLFANTSYIDDMGSHGGSGASILSFQNQKIGDTRWARLPESSKEFLLNMQKQNAKREGDVRIERVEKVAKSDESQK